MSGRNGAAKENCELSVGNARNIGVQVVTEGWIDGRGGGSFDLEGGAQRRVLHVVPDVDRPGTGLGLPRTARGLPVAEGVVIEGDGNAHRPTGGNLDLCESFELAGGAEHTAGGTHVQLDDVSTVTLGRIGDRESRALLVHLEIGVLEARVRESVAKGDGNVDARSREVAIADEGAFAVVGQRAACRVPGGGRVIVVRARIRFGQVSRRVHSAGEDVKHRTGATLTAQVTVDEGGHRVRPWHLHAGTTGQDDDGTRIRCGDGLDEAILPIGKPHVGPIQPFGFGQLVETNVNKRDVSVLGEGHGLGDESVARAAMTVITAGVSCQNEASGILSLRFEQRTRSIDACGVDLGGTRSLEARCIRKIADQGDARASAQRKEIVLIAQKRDRLGDNTRSQLVMLVEVVGRGCGQAGARARDVQDVLGTRVDVSRIQFSSLDRRDDLTRTSKAGGGHLEATTGAHRCNGAV